MRVVFVIKTRAAPVTLSRRLSDDDKEDETIHRTRIYRLSKPLKAACPFYLHFIAIFIVFYLFLYITILPFLASPVVPGVCM